MTRRPASTTTLAALWLTGALVFFAAEAMAAAAVTPPYQYSYATDYISELCVPGWTRLAAVMRTGLCVQGVLFFIGAVFAARMSARRHRLFVLLAALYGFGIVLVGAVPIGPDAPAINSTVFHAMGALLAIIGGNATILAGSSVVAELTGVRWYRTVSMILGVLGFVSFLILWQPAAQPSLGIWERGSVYSVMVWQIITGILLLAHRRAASPTGIARRH